MLTETQLRNAKNEELEGLANRIATELEARRASEEKKRSRKVVEKHSSSRGTLQQELVRCGKEGCKKCASGPAHGPYWYHYFYKDGRLVSRYIGKEPKEEYRERFPELFEPSMEAGEDRA